MQGYVHLKHKLSGGSTLSATIPAVTEGLIFFKKYILLQETEKLGPELEASVCSSLSRGV